MEPSEAQLRTLYRLIQSERLAARYLIYTEEDTIASSEAGALSAIFGRIEDIVLVQAIKEYIIYRNGQYIDTEIYPE